MRELFRKITDNAFKNKLQDQLYWWLNKKRPFYINDEYKIELLHIHRGYDSAKILITNLKTGETSGGD